MASQNPLAPSIALGWLQTGRAGRIRAGSEAIERWLEAERDQIPLWLPVGLGLGIAAWFALPDMGKWLAFMAAAGGVAGFGFTLARGGRLGRVIGIFALIAMIGCGLIWFRAERVAVPRIERPMVAAFEARIVSVERLPARGSIRLKLVPIGEAAIPPLVRVNVKEEEAPPGLAPGARIALRARLMPPAPPAVPGAYDFARVAWFQGLGATGKTIGPVRVVGVGESGGFSGWIANLRARLSAHVQDRLAGAEGGVAAAFVAGDQGAIPEADADAMRRSGLAHLL